MHTILLITTMVVKEVLSAHFTGEETLAERAEDVAQSYRQ